MKFNGNYIKQFSGVDYYKGIKTGKKIKTAKPKKSTRLEKIEPIFTYHSLQRLSERIAKQYTKECKLIVGKYIVSGEFERGWIPPSLIIDCIWDIKHSMYKDLLYSEERDSFAIDGNIAIYIISRKHEIITIYKEFDKEEKRRYRHVAQRDALIFFNL